MISSSFMSMNGKNDVIKAPWSYAAFCVEVVKPNLFGLDIFSWQDLIFKANNCWFN